MKNPIRSFAVPHSLHAQFEAREAQIRQATLEALAAAISEYRVALAREGLLQARTGAASNQTFVN